MKNLSSRSVLSQIFILFSLLIIVVSFLFVLFFTYSEHVRMETDLINRGKLISNMVANTFMMWSFLKKEDNSQKPLLSPYIEDIVVAISIYTNEGALVAEERKSGWRESMRFNWSTQMFDRLRKSEEGFVIKNPKVYEYWKPVMSFDSSEFRYGHVDHELEISGRSINSDIIGFVRVEFKKDSLLTAMHSFLLKVLIVSIGILAISLIFVYKLAFAITVQFRKLQEYLQSNKTLGNSNLLTTDSFENEIKEVSNICELMLGSISQMEEERKELAKKIDTTKRVETMSIISRGIAHDISNFFAKSILNLDNVLRNIASGNDVYQMVENSRKSIVFAQDLSFKFLEFIKGNELNMEVVSISQTIRELTELIFDNTEGSGTKFKLNIENNLYYAYADKTKVDQVMSNIMINAKQSLPNRNGLVTVTAENKTLSADFKSSHIEDFVDGDYIKVTVADNGNGLSKETLSRVFEPFFTTKKSGTGMGLATAYSIVKKHKGFIGAESEEGIGSAFMVYLPAAKREALTNSNHSENNEIETLNNFIDKFDYVIN